MAGKPKNKMPIADRAKQFMPFAALKGLPEALARKEGEVISCTEFMEERSEEFGHKLHSLYCGLFVTITYYSDSEYRKTAGRINRIEKEEGFLQVNNEKIRFPSIYEIQEGCSSK